MLIVRLYMLKETEQEIVKIKQNLNVARDRKKVMKI